jgi:hypothetical protein
MKKVQKQRGLQRVVRRKKGDKEKGTEEEIRIKTYWKK